MHGLTFEAHYALVALVSMARHPNPVRGVLQMKQISAKESLPAPFLSKILLKLRHAGLIFSRHGRGGGYALARSPFEITVRDVLTACREEPVAFDIASACVSANPTLKLGLAKLNAKLEKTLQETTVGDLAGMPRPEELGRPAELYAAV